MAFGAGRVLRWAPRILSVALGLFFAVFALDAFEHGGNFGVIVLAFLMHLLPSVLVFLVLALAWRRPVVGSAAFTLLAALYVTWAWGRLRPASWLPVAVPLLAIAALFLADAVARARRGDG